MSGRSWGRRGSPILPSVHPCKNDLVFNGCYRRPTVGVAVVASSVSLVCVKPLPVAPPPRNGSDRRGPSGHSRKRASPTTTPRAAPKNQQGGPYQGGGGGGGGGGSRLSHRLTRWEEKYQNERSKTGERERERSGRGSPNETSGERERRGTLTWSFSFLRGTRREGEGTLVLSPACKKGSSGSSQRWPLHQ